MDKSGQAEGGGLHVSGHPLLWSIYLSIVLFIHGSPSGKRPDLQGAMLKKKKKRLSCGLCKR